LYIYRYAPISSFGSLTKKQAAVCQMSLSMVSIAHANIGICIWVLLASKDSYQDSEHAAQPACFLASSFLAAFKATCSIQPVPKQSESEANFCDI